MTLSKAFTLAWLAAAGLCTSLAATQPETRSLAGTWRFELDLANTGLQNKCFERWLPGTIKLPGSLPAQGIGENISVNTRWTGGIVDKSWFTEPQYERYRQPGNVKVPFWLQPDKYYAGPAWYQRDVHIPEQWKHQRVVLTLERPHWETRVWLDGKYLGSNNSLSTAHEYELGTGLAPGRHQLTIRVDNGLVVDIGENSHCITDHTQGNWNGIAGDISLRATPPVWLKDLQVYPNLSTKSVKVKGQIGNATGQPGQGSVSLSVMLSHASRERQALAGKFGPTQTLPVSWQAAGGSFEASLPVLVAKEPQAWDEFNPELYSLTAELKTSAPIAQASKPAVSPTSKSAAATSKCSATFGLREVAIDGPQLLLNGRKLFIRGTLECCIFPLTGHPPTDVASWKRLIRIAKAHGLNLIRFHSYCPPEAAFIAADELGFYYQVETCWANQSTTIGDGKLVDQWVYDETDRILQAYGNHPSFLLMPYGNEPGGKKAAEYLAKWVGHYKALDARRLWTSGAGWPELPENQFHVTPNPRIQHWGAALKSRINSQPPETTTDYADYINQRNAPVISHEIGQWCVYPNFDEIPKYKGYLKAKNFQIFRDSLKAHHMAGQARAFLLASGKLQTLCYKEDIESALRTPRMGGFQLLDLHDFPGQGTALVGVLDPFWDSKGYVTAAEYSRFCNSTVPLVRLPKRVFTAEEKLEAHLEVAHFGPAPLTNAQAIWKLVADNKRVLKSGQLPSRTIELGNGIALGGLSLELRDLPAPARYKLVVTVGRFENHWDIWVYPAQLSSQPPSGIAIIESLDDPAVTALNNGGKALLLIPPTRVKGKVGLGFSSIFWNTAWTRGQKPHTLGILCEPKHPALAEFPTDYHSNWQWWYLVSRAGAMVLDDLPKELRPTIQIIDDWVTNRKLGLLFEARVGQGKLMVCSIDLQRGLDQNPVARQLLRSVLDYMAGPKFKPAVALTPARIQNLISDAPAGQNRNARVHKADSFADGYEPENAVDGDPATFWHTSWEEPKPPFPHELQLALDKAIKVHGFTVLPRRDGNPNGWIKDYELYVSADGKDWGAPVAKGAFAADAKLKQVLLPSPVSARYVRLVALSGHAHGPWASLAEFTLLE